jgi:hypothetical protein
MKPLVHVRTTGFVKCDLLNLNARRDEWYEALHAAEPWCHGLSGIANGIMVSVLDASDKDMCNRSAYDRVTGLYQLTLNYMSTVLVTRREG